MDINEDAPEPPKQKDAKPVPMEVVAEKDNKPIKKNTRAKYGRRGKGKAGGTPLPPKEMVEFKWADIGNLWQQNESWSLQVFCIFLVVFLSLYHDNIAPKQFPTSNRCYRLGSLVSYILSSPLSH